jgi:hypothetical protein
MADWDPAAFEDNLIADMRAHGGAVRSDRSPAIHC